MSASVFDRFKKKKNESFMIVELEKGKPGKDKYIRDSKGSVTAKCFRKLHSRSSQ